MFGKIGPAEILILLIVLVGIPILTYFLGRRAGYNKGQLDLYKKKEKQSKE